MANLENPAPEEGLESRADRLNILKPTGTTTQDSGTLAEIPLDVAASEQVIDQVAEPAAEPKKKRYYSPNEVMKKRGCIGCGGMVLAAPFIVAAVGLVAVAVR